ncbi:MAG: NosD domain-containing protein, partial [Candidatus Hodarchaeota archaeon]
FHGTYSASFENPRFPTEDYPFSIALFWYDLRADNNIYIWSTPNFIVIEYNNYNYYYGETVGTFEVVLFPNGNILFQYLHIETAYAPTVGLNCGMDKNYYTSYSESLTGSSNFAILFSWEELTGNITGTVTEFTSGNPIQNVNVSLFIYNQSFGWSLLHSTFADENGLYQLDNIPINYDYQIIAFFEEYYHDIKQIHFSVIDWPHLHLDLSLLNQSYGSQAVVTFLNSSSSEPLENVKVVVFEDSWDKIPEKILYSDSSGQILIQNISHADYRWFNVSYANFEDIERHYISPLPMQSSIELVMLMVHEGASQNDADSGDDAGNDPSGAVPITIPFKETLESIIYKGSFASSINDQTDWFSFTVTNLSVVSIELFAFDNHGSDFDLSLYNEYLDRVASSSTPSPNSDSISYDLLPGRYYIVVEYAFGALTNYSLKADGLSITLEDHNPILIFGNDEFLNQANIEGWLGDGTPSNPIIISGFNFSDSNLIEIFNTELHFKICNSSFTGGGIEGTGIYLNNVRNGQITHNIIADNYYGIHLENSKIISVTNNLILNCNTGIFLDFSGEISLINNKMYKNGLFFNGLRDYNYFHEITANYINNKPLIYWLGIHDEKVPDNVGQIVLVECSNIEITSQDVSKASVGIFGRDCLSLNITKVNSSHNIVGISLELCYENIIRDSTFMNNDREGLILRQCDDNVISDGIFINNTYGISLNYGSSNSIERNQINASQAFGIYVFSSRYNSIIDNNLTNNG